MELFKPTGLYACLRAVYRREQLLSLLKGAMALGKWLVLLFLAGFALDWLIRLPAPARGIVLVLLLAFSIYKAWQLGWQYFRAFSLTLCALKVETHYEDLGSILVAGVQLREQSPRGGVSASMAEYTIRKADEAVVPLNAEDVVSFRELQRPATQTAFLCAVIGAIAIINSSLLLAGLARIFMPWQAVSYPTRTYVELDGKEIIVKEGDSVRILARLSGEIPETATLALRTGKGKPRRRTLEVVGNACEYKMAAAFRSFDDAISAGDAASDWHTVKVISSPRVVKTEIRLTYPSYMDRPPESMEAMTLAVPEGASMEWNLQLDRPLSSAAFRIEGGERIPLEVSGDGLTVSHKIEAAASGAYSFSWVEKEHGFSFETARHFLQVAPDQPPQVEFTSPQGNLFATIERKLVLAYRARDDHGIGEAKVVYRHNNAPEQRVPLSPQASVGGPRDRDGSQDRRLEEHP